MLAGLGGAVFGHSLARLSFANFPTQASLDVAAMSVLGGLGILLGPLLGALYIIGVPAFLPLDAAGLAGTAFGWLVLILYVPGGIAQVVEPLRIKIVELLARRSGLDAKALMHGEEAETGIGEVEEWRPDRVLPAGDADRPVVEVRDVTKSFGRVIAVAGVSLDVRPGETLGIIGPNGAGKTTLFDLLSGFIKPDEGHVTLEGHDITSRSPESRARMGLIRSFQEGSLFETLTVIDTIRLARERLEPTNLGAAVLGLRRSERRKEERARDLVRLLGLERYGRKQIRELSTGTRRVVELACMLALEPRVLLLDEPSAGIAQRETELLGALLEKVKSQLGASLVVIEHDMPLITSLADRMIAMAEGRVIAEGKPSAVQRDPLVVSSYLGTDSLAIRRSGTLSKPRSRARRGERTRA
jgi:ABC-type branched-subunit amino acid transport system ATPase component